MQIYSMRIHEKVDEQPLKNEYSEKFQKMSYYLITLIRSNHLNRKEFYKFKN